jgi:hypothetical protein
MGGKGILPRLQPPVRPGDLGQCHKQERLVDDVGVGQREADGLKPTAPRNHNRAVGIEGTGPADQMQPQQRGTSSDAGDDDRPD